jgi:phosphatidate phosphatase LPIN
MSKLWKKFSTIWDYNSSTLSGCLDVIVVEDEAGQLRCSPFHFRVGKLKVFITDLKVVKVFINNKEAKYQMKLSKNGVGFFECAVEEGDLQDPDSDFSSNHVQSDDEGQVKKNEIDLNDSMNTEKINYNVSADFEMDKQELNTRKRLSDLKIRDDYLLEKQTDKHHEEAPDVQSEAGTQIKLSLCGHLLDTKMGQNEINEIFERNIIQFKGFDTNPINLLNNENLMIKIGDKMYDSYFGIPQIISLLAYDRELSSMGMNTMKQNLQQEFNDEQEDVILRKNSVEIGGNIEEAKKILIDPHKSGKSQPRIRKTLKPPSDFWENLELTPGLNHIQYRVKGNLNTEHILNARLFYYKYQKQYRIVISDIDGTITRSDLLGHLMPFIYKDWSHNGIAEFFQNLSERGYLIVYLTARNIGQSHKTLTYLKSICQNGIKLPEGPLITSPDSLYESLKREMIIKNPEDFKIRVLRDIRKIFGDQTHNPVYSGFGNKDTDAIAYMVSGIPKNRIFTINPDGEIFVLKSVDILSYTHLNKNIDEVYPVFDNSTLPTIEESEIAIGNSEDGVEGTSLAKIEEKEKAHGPNASND